MLVAVVVGLGALVIRSTHRPVQDVAETLPTGCSSQSSAQALPSVLTAAGGSTVITPAGAAAILKSVWPVRQDALHACDVATLKQIDTGSALVGDVSRATCGCLYTPDGAPLLDSRVFVPRQTSYPAFFTSEVRTQEKDGTSWTEVMVFTRTSRQASWRVNLATGWAADPGREAVLGTPRVDAGGYTVPVAAGMRRRAGSAADDLVTLWRQAKLTGTVPSTPLAPGPWTTGIAAQRAEHPQDTVQGNGLRGHFGFAHSDPTYQVSENGYSLACTVIRVTATYTDGGNGHPQQSRDQKNWGADLAPGAYRSITSRGVSQTCFVIVPDAATPVTVAGGDNTSESVTTGVPLSS